MAILKGEGYDIQRGGSLSFGLVPDLIGLPKIHIEVKRREKLNLGEAMKQAREDAAFFGGMPTLFHRRNREPWCVTMDLDDWLALYRAWESNA